TFELDLTIKIEARCECMQLLLLPAVALIETTTDDHKPQPWLSLDHVLHRIKQQFDSLASAPKSNKEGLPRRSGAAGLRREDFSIYAGGQDDKPVRVAGESRDRLSREVADCDLKCALVRCANCAEAGTEIVLHPRRPRCVLGDQEGNTMLPRQV